MASIIYPMRFSEKDRHLYDEGVRLAKIRRTSLAEILRRLLIVELDNAKPELDKASLPDKHSLD